jgi:hypothetical protein
MNMDMLQDMSWTEVIFPIKVRIACTMLMLAKIWILMWHGIHLRVMALRNLRKGILEVFGKKKRCSSSW